MDRLGRERRFSVAHSELVSDAECGGFRDRRSRYRGYAGRSGSNRLCDRLRSLGPQIARGILPGSPVSGNGKPCRCHIVCRHCRTADRLALSEVATIIEKPPYETEAFLYQGLHVLYYTPLREGRISTRVCAASSGRTAPWRTGACNTRCRTCRGR